jgi:hypothetical protein
MELCTGVTSKTGAACALLIEGNAAETKRQKMVNRMALSPFPPPFIVTYHFQEQNIHRVGISIEEALTDAPEL